MKSTAMSRYLRAQGYTTRTMRDAETGRVVTVARRHEGDLMRVAVYPVAGGASYVKYLNRAVHSKLGRMLPAVVQHGYLVGALATPEHIADALL